MKKVLFATTAAVALALAGTAQAETKVGGFAEVFAGDSSSTTEDDINLAADMEVFVTTSRTLDNGLTAGARFEFEANAEQDLSANVDEASVTLGGGFGTVILGWEDDVQTLLGVAAPFAGNPYQNTILFNQNHLQLTGDDIKAIYTAPAFVPGLAAGAQVELPGNNGTELGWSAAANYGLDMSGIAAKFSGGFGNDGTDNYWTAGAQVGLSGITAGGQVLKVGDGDMYIAAGAQYAMGPLAVSGTWATGPAVLVGIGAVDLDTTIVGAAAYKLGAGVSIKVGAGLVNGETAYQGGLSVGL